MKTQLFVILSLFALASCSETKQPPKLKFTRIKEGIFFFGSDFGADHERPAVLCRLNTFQLSTTEVSNEQFEAFVEATNYVTDAEKHGGFVYDISWKLNPKANWRKPLGKEVDYQTWKELPVVQVSYSDALAYCKWAGCRLPTELEWEFASKKGMYDLREINIMNPGQKRASPVKVQSLPKNDLGVHHQLGNVWEWCSDVYNSEIHDKLALQSTTEPFYADRKNGFQSKSFDPLKKEVNDTLRVIKGGSFLCQKGYCEGYRPEARQSAEQSEAYFHIGFRVVK